MPQDMRALVVYDSFFGNTEQIALAIGAALRSQMDVAVRRVGDVQPGQLAGLRLLIVGSPTRGFRPSPETVRFLKSIPAHGLRGVEVAAFDTRISLHDTDSRLLRFMIGLFGYAAEPIASRLNKKGGKLAVPPEGFIVDASEGPLQEGELERAAAWARRILALLAS